MNGKEINSLHALIQVDPNDDLLFKLSTSTPVQSSFTITNVTTDSYLAFKVKTTCPMRYLVRPNQGIIGPSGKASIIIIMQEKDCNDLLQISSSERQKLGDKFLIQSAVVDTNFCENLAGKQAKDVAEELNKLWNVLHKSQLYKKKLRCCFLSDNEAPTSIRNSYLPETTPRDNWRTERSSGAIKSSGGLPGDEDQDFKKELHTLREKYDELVAYTVQITAQRDRLTHDLDKLQKNTTESSGTASEGLRNRRPLARGAAEPSRTGTMEQSKPPANNMIVFGIIAVLFFLIGRYYSR